MALTKVDISLMDNTGTTANKLLAYDGSGNLPAVDGSQLTNVATGITESTSDPVITTNPSGGVGTQWNNTTSGEVYICTDATAGENVWTNVGAGSGRIPEVFTFQGTQYGYRAGGYNLSTGAQNVIEKYSFTTDGNSTDVGNITTAGHYSCSGTGITHGYMGGVASTGKIEKWSYSSGGDSTLVGTLALSASHGVASSSDGSYVFWHDGQGPAPQYGNTGIQKTSFATDGNSVDTGGDLLDQWDSSGGHTSSTHGYNSGGTGLNQIQKFSFSISSGTATDVGNLTQTKFSHSCYSSTDYGYAAGTTSSNVIDRFSFSSDGNATDWGDLNYSPNRGSGTSSETHGFTHGGEVGNVYKNHISKIAFASAGTATDVGDLTLIVAYMGHTGSNY